LPLDEPDDEDELEDDELELLDDEELEEDDELDELPNKLCTAISRVVVVPSPISPSKFAPTAQAVPSLFRNRLCP